MEPFKRATKYTEEGETSVSDSTEFMHVDLSELYSQGVKGVRSEIKAVGGTKYDLGKPRLELLDRHALESIAEVMSFGAKKYGEFNWKSGFKWSRLYGAALRHLLAHMDGENLDEESGKSHLAHAACCIQFLLWHEKNRPDLDDRYSPETKKESGK